MLSDTPPERDIEWTDAGAEGCWRFVQRIWRLVSEAEGLPPPGTPAAADDEASKTLRQATHKAIAAVTDDLAASALQPRRGAALHARQCHRRRADKADAAARREALEALVLLTAPMMPHLAEDCWQALGHDRLVAETPWPKHDPALLTSDTVTIAVQVNGKRRGDSRRWRATPTSKTVEAAALARGRRHARPGRQDAEEGHRRARPHREHRRMKRSAPAALRMRLLLARLRLSSALWRPDGRHAAATLASIYVEPVAGTRRL